MDDDLTADWSSGFARQVFTKFYKKHEPDKADQIDEILKHFKGRWYDLVQVIEAKYHVRLQANGHFRRKTKADDHFVIVTETEEESLLGELKEILDSRRQSEGQYVVEGIGQRDGNLPPPNTSHRQLSAASAQFAMLAVALPGFEATQLQAASTRLRPTGVLDGLHKKVPRSSSSASSGKRSSSSGKRRRKRKEEHKKEKGSNSRSKDKESSSTLQKSLKRQPPKLAERPKQTIQDNQEAKASPATSQKLTKRQPPKLAERPKQTIRDNQEAKASTSQKSTKRQPPKVAERPKQTLRYSEETKETKSNSCNDSVRSSNSPRRTEKHRVAKATTSAIARATRNHDKSRSALSDTASASSRRSSSRREGRRSKSRGTRSVGGGGERNRMDEVEAPRPMRRSRSSASQSSRRKPTSTRVEESGAKELIWKKSREKGTRERDLIKERPRRNDLDRPRDRDRRRVRPETTPIKRGTPAVEPHTNESRTTDESSNQDKGLTASLKTGDNSGWLTASSSGSSLSPKRASIWSTDKQAESRYAPEMVHKGSKSPPMVHKEFRGPPLVPKRPQALQQEPQQEPTPQRNEPQMVPEKSNGPKMEPAYLFKGPKMVPNKSNGLKPVPKRYIGPKMVPKGPQMAHMPLERRSLVSLQSELPLVRSLTPSVIHIALSQQQLEKGLPKVPPRPNIQEMSLPEEEQEPIEREVGDKRRKKSNCKPETRKRPQSTSSTSSKRSSGRNKKASNMSPKNSKTDNRLRITGVVWVFLVFFLPSVAWLFAAFGLVIISGPTWGVKELKTYLGCCAVLFIAGQLPATMVGPPMFTTIVRSLGLAVVAGWANQQTRDAIEGRNLYAVEELEER